MLHPQSFSCFRSFGFIAVLFTFLFSQEIGWSRDLVMYLYSIIQSVFYPCVSVSYAVRTSKTTRAIVHDKVYRAVFFSPGCHYYKICLDRGFQSNDDGIHLSKHFFDRFHSNPLDCVWAFRVNVERSIYPSVVRPETRFLLLSFTSVLSLEPASYPTKSFELNCTVKTLLENACSTDLYQTLCPLFKQVGEVDFILSSPSFDPYSHPFYLVVPQDPKDWLLSFF